MRILLCKFYTLRVLSSPGPSYRWSKSSQLPYFKIRQEKSKLCWNEILEELPNSSTFNKCKYLRKNFKTSQWEPDTSLWEWTEGTPSDQVRISYDCTKQCWDSTATETGLKCALHREKMARKEVCVPRLAISALWKLQPLPLGLMLPFAGELRHNTYTFSICHPNRNN